MPYTFTYEIKDTHIEAVVSGHVRSYDELEELVGTFTRTLVDSGHTRFLLKERGMDLAIDVHDVVMLTDYVNLEMTQTLGVKVACHYAPCNAKINRAFETCHQNRSLNFRAFARLDDACEWLLS